VDKRRLGSNNPPVSLLHLDGNDVGSFQVDDPNKAVLVYCWDRGLGEDLHTHLADVALRSPSVRGEICLMHVVLFSNCVPHFTCLGFICERAMNADYWESVTVNLPVTAGKVHAHLRVWGKRRNVDVECAVSHVQLERSSSLRVSVEDWSRSASGGDGNTSFQLDDQDDDDGGDGDGDGDGDEGGAVGAMSEDDDGGGDGDGDEGGAVGAMSEDDDGGDYDDDGDDGDYVDDDDDGDDDSDGDVGASFEIMHLDDDDDNGGGGEGSDGGVGGTSFDLGGDDDDGDDDGGFSGRSIKLDPEDSHFLDVPWTTDGESGGARDTRMHADTMMEDSDLQQGDANVAIIPSVATGNVRVGVLERSFEEIAIAGRCERSHTRSPSLPRLHTHTPTYLHTHRHAQTGGNGAAA